MNNVILIPVDDDLIEFAKQTPVTSDEINEAKNKLKELENEN